jgi:phage tail-like protein
MNMNRKFKIFTITVLILLIALFSFTPTAVTAIGPISSRGIADPLTSFNCQITLDDGFTGYFTDISGMGTTQDLIEHKIIDSTGKEIIRLLPGRLHINPIIMKRGITTDKVLWEWRQMVVNGDMKEARKSGEIIVFDRNNTEVAKWSFTDGWLSELKTTNENGMMLETATLVCEGITRIK